MSVFAAAQDEVCDCSPYSYIFELKLDSITCPTSPSDLGPGVSSFICNPEGEIPDTITGAKFVLNSFYSQTKSGLNLGDGDTLELVLPPGIELVNSIELILYSGVSVQNVVSITFTNECGVLALNEGAELGLVVLVSLEKSLLISSNVHCLEID